MKISIIGGGAWGSTLAQALADNNHECLIFDINENNVKLINDHQNPYFETDYPKSIRATLNYPDLVDFSNIFLIALPTAYIRKSLRELNTYLKNKTSFINVSKGIEVDSLKRVSEIVIEEISPDKLLSYAVLTGPSHAEDLIKRKTTLLTAASIDESFARDVQLIFSNDSYLRVYTSSDVIGCEFGGATKNAIAVVSGILTGLDLGENARAALITRGILEIVRVVKVMGGNEQTAFGLTGVGDLVVTASSMNSRNFRAGVRIGEGDTLNDIYSEAKQTIEGIRSIDALHRLSLKYDLDLPIINSAYEVIFEEKNAKLAIKELLNRKLKSETI